MWRLDDLRGANNYLDTNVLIYALEGDEADNRRHQLGALFRDLAEGPRSARASLPAPRFWARPLREGDLPLVNWYRELLSGRGLVEVLAVNQVIPDLAADLRAEQRSLRVPDALHLATAIHIGCASFVTADEKLTIDCSSHSRAPSWRSGESGLICHAPPYPPTTSRTPSSATSSSGEYPMRLINTCGMPLARWPAALGLPYCLRRYYE